MQRLCNFWSLTSVSLSLFVCVALCLCLCACEMAIATTRLQPPATTPERILPLLSRCCHVSPKDRPLFADLSERLESEVAIQRGVLTNATLFPLGAHGSEEAVVVSTALHLSL